MPIALKEKIYSVKFHSMPGVIFVVSMNHLNGFYKVPKVPIFTRNRFKIRQERSPNIPFIWQSVTRLVRSCFISTLPTRKHLKSITLNSNITFFFLSNSVLYFNWLSFSSFNQRWSENSKCWLEISVISY